VARIIQIKKSKEKYTSRIQSEVSAEYNEFYDGGEKFVRIQTFGSEDRENHGKQSQNIQLNRKAAEELVRLLRDSFNI
jgi:hypothetical protein